MEKDTKENNAEKENNIQSNNDMSSSVIDYECNRSYDQPCIVYKFQARPPYEGFVLILVIVVIAILLIWWLYSKLKASEQ